MEVAINRYPENPGREDFKNNLRKMIQEENEGIPYRRGFLVERYDRLVRLLDQKIVTPYELEIQPSSKCNSKCTFCFSKVTLKGKKRLANRLFDKGNMDTLLDKILAYEHEGFGVDTIKFVGTCGDPLVNPHTGYAIERCAAADKNVKMFTNGIGFQNYADNGGLEKLARASQIVISLDAGSAQTHRRIKKYKKINKSEDRVFYNILENIHQLGYLKEGINPKLSLTVDYVITKENYHEIEEAGNLAEKCRAGNIVFRQDFTCKDKFDDEENRKITLSLKHAKLYETDWFRIYNKIIDEADLTTEKFKTQTRCYLPLIWMVVGSDGSVVPCGHRGGDFGWNYGNLLEDDMEKIISNMQKSQRKLPDKDCKVCSAFPRSINPFLDYIFRNREEVWIKDALDQLKKEYEQEPISS